MSLRAGFGAVWFNRRFSLGAPIHWGRNYYQSSAEAPTEVKIDGKPTRVIDMRSDVLTKPTQRMKEAMLQASYGDDVFNEDRCVHELQDTVAELFGKEAALFVPSGTMANLISVLNHCSYARGLEVLMGDKSHLLMYEQGGVATLGGVHPRSIPNLQDGMFDLDILPDYIRPRDDPHQPQTALIAVENTHANCGGKAVPMDFLCKLKSIAESNGVKVHMDGARLMNAAVSLGVKPSDLLKHVDTTTMCFSKGLGTPIGSVIAGSRQFIDSAIRLRKVLGGGWRQPGLLAAAALVSLEDAEVRLQRDHQNAKKLAQTIQVHSHGVVEVDVEGVHSNIILVHMKKPGLTAQQFSQRLEVVTDDEENRGFRVLVHCGTVYNYIARICTYHNLSDNDLQIATDKIVYVLTEYAGRPNSEVEHRTHMEEQEKKEKQDWFTQRTSTVPYKSLLYNLDYRK